MRTIDDGAPQYNPRTHYVSREWIEEEISEPDDEGGGEHTFLQRTAVYTILPIPASPERVKAEAQRRIIALTGATDLQSCLIKQLNANMRANELNDKRVSGGALTSDEEAEAAALRALAAAIKAIRARSDEIELLNPIPDDYAADEHWL